jgi:hypothetical protein
LAHKDPQTDVDAFGPFGLFQCAAAHINGNRCGPYGFGIRTVGTRFACRPQQ